MRGKGILEYALTRSHGRASRTGRASHWYTGPRCKKHCAFQRAGRVEGERPFLPFLGGREWTSRKWPRQDPESGARRTARRHHSHKKSSAEGAPLPASLRVNVLAPGESSARFLRFKVKITISLSPTCFPTP